MIKLLNHNERFVIQTSGNPPLMQDFSQFPLNSCSCWKTKRVSAMEAKKEINPNHPERNTHCLPRVERSCRNKGFWVQTTVLQQSDCRVQPAPSSSKYKAGWKKQGRGLVMDNGNGQPHAHAPGGFSPGPLLTVG